MLSSLASADPLTFTSSLGRPSLPPVTPVAGCVLHPGVFIAGPTGDILFWNDKAREALEHLGNAGCLDDLFDADALERLFGRREWVAVTPRGTADVWRVRVRRLLDSGRSLVFFFAGAEAS
jgi:hypothetical protein